MDLYDSYVRKNSDLRSAVELRVSGLDSRPVTFQPAIKPQPGTDPTPEMVEAQRLADMLQRAWARGPSQTIIRHLVRSGRMYGVAPVEIGWSVTDEGILWTDLWPTQAKAMLMATVHRNSEHPPGTWLLRTSSLSASGEPLVPGKWIVGSPNPELAAGDRALMATSVFDGVFGQSVLGGWTLFLERYGLPFLHVEVEDYTDAKAVATARQIIRRAGDDHGVVTGVHDKFSVNVIDGAMATRSGTSDPHDRYLTANRDRIARLWTGGTLLQSTGAGGSYNQGAVHENSFLALLQTDARYIEATLQRDLVGPWAEFNEIPPALVPKVALRIRLDTPGAVANLASQLGNAGYDMDTRELSETLGFTITRRPDA